MEKTARNYKSHAKLMQFSPASTRLVHNIVFCVQYMLHNMCWGLGQLLALMHDCAQMAGCMWGSSAGFVK